MVFFFFFKQKTAYEMRISYWSSDVCSSDLKTVADYDHGLSRIDGFVAFLDAAAVRMREGAARGVTQPRLVVENMIGQLDTLIAQGVDKSTFYGPIRNMPEGFTDAEKARDRKSTSMNSRH